jgi:DNA repair exonuclease SbcCD ATPase subunit
MNLLSTGNVFTEVSLDTHGQTLIVGENGAGKSTILDALSFVLYGKSFRKINKPQLVNTINEKNLLVECDFSIGNRTYKVRRGIKPTVFEIYIDGSLLNQDAESVDYQDVLEKQILKLNHKTFSQVVVLGSASFVPFMQLAAQPRRDIIEDLLDIQVFTTMNTLLKEKIATNKNNLVDVDYRISNTEDKINIEKQHLSVLEQNKDDLVKQKTQQIDYYIEQVKNANSQATTLLHEITELQSTINDQSKVRSRQEKILTLSRRIDINLEKAQKDEEFFKAHDNCPTCRQGIADGHKASILKETSSKLYEIQQGKQKITEELAAISARLIEITNITSIITAKQNEVSTKQIQVAAWEKFVQDTQKEIDTLVVDNDFNTNKDRLINLQNKLQELGQLKEKLVREKSVYDVAGVLLKDAGIKTKIIRQYIPVINKLINKYLAAMDFFVNFELNENFEEKIKSRFRDDFSYSSFSEGEKSRIDLALLFTWRAIAKLRNSASTNILILDEVFDGSLDARGNEELLKILQTLTEGSNVFVISHKTDAFLDKFERVLKFEKHKNFSRMITL